jgi:mono/diheme cytochrome c family protein
MIRDQREPAAPRKIAAPVALPGASALVMTILLCAAPAAQADNVGRGQRIWHDKAECIYCHGWAADGDGGFHHPGRPPSLRDTQLTRDEIRTTIQCGRPGTAMPHFDRFAYTDKRCYDMSAADLGNMVPDNSTTPLQPEEIDALADYIAAKLKGAGPVTRGQCADYFSPTAARCDRYPER